MQVIEDYLEEEYFNHLYGMMTNQTMWQWNFQRNVAAETDQEEEDINNYYFVHPMYDYMDVVNPSTHQYFLPLLRGLDIKCLHRSRVLMYVNQGKQIIHSRHVDMDESCTTALLYMNTNNGFTEFETGERVESIKNRLLLFDGSVKHSSSTPTDTKYRMLISVTYK